MKRKNNNNKKSRKPKRANNRNRRTRGNNLTFAPTTLNRTFTNRNRLKSLPITHREFVRDIFSNGTGTQIFNYQINPGIPVEFPWLSSLANSFETYIFHNLTYKFVPVLSTSTDGAVALCPDYDAADIDGTHDKSELLSFEDSARGSIWAELTMKCSPRNLKKRKQFFVRNSDLAANLDIKSYDTGQINIVLSTDKPNGAVLGELWVEYSISLMTPQLNHSTSSYPDSYQYESNGVTESSTIFNHEVHPPLYSSGSMKEDKIIVFNDTLTTLSATQMLITRAGDYLFNLYSDVSDHPEFVLTQDSDTGDSQLFAYLPSFDGATYYRNFLIKCGSLTSSSNPVTIQLAAAAATGLFEYIITRIKSSIPQTETSRKVKPKLRIPSFKSSPRRAQVIKKTIKEVATKTQNSKCALGRSHIGSTQQVVDCVSPACNCQMPAFCNLCYKNPVQG